MFAGRRCTMAFYTRLFDWNYEGTPLEYDGERHHLSWNAPRVGCMAWVQDPHGVLVGLIAPRIE